MRLTNEEEFINEVDVGMADGIESICLKCKNKSLMPDFIYDECSRYIAYKELKYGKSYYYLL